MPAKTSIIVNLEYNGIFPSAKQKEMVFTENNNNKLVRWKKVKLYKVVKVTGSQNPSPGDQLEESDVAILLGNKNTTVNITASKRIKTKANL